MTTKERYEGVLGWFAGKMPVAESELKYNDPFELIVAVILSAQCTDKRVNMTTPALFERFPDAKAMAAGTVEDIYHLTGRTEHFLQYGTQFQSTMEVSE